MGEFHKWRPGSYWPDLRAYPLLSAEWCIGSFVLDLLPTTRMELGLPMIELHDVHVDYMVQRHGFSSIKSYLTSFGTKRLLERKRILHGVDLRIDSGECFGIVGRNGSGKSTLLRLLAGIVEPSKGVANIRGRVAPMLALGVGLEPELSGWENVRLCRLLMGHEHRDRDAIRRYVSTFSGLSDEDLAMQVKRYSTGHDGPVGIRHSHCDDRRNPVDR